MCHYIIDANFHIFHFIVAIAITNTINYLALSCAPKLLLENCSKMRDFHKMMGEKKHTFLANVTDNEYLLLGHMHQKTTPIKYGKQPKSHPHLLLIHLGAQKHDILQ